MTVKELKEKLANVPDDLEVRIMNVAIEDDEHCPSFELSSVEELKYNKVVWLSLQFTHSYYLRRRYNHTPE